MTQLPSLQWSAKVDVADWISNRLHPFDQHDAGSVIPAGFAAYARILHPAWRWETDGALKIRWGMISEWTGRVVHPQVQFHELSQSWARPGILHGRSVDLPHEGSLPADDLVALTEILADDSDTPDHCWFCLWDGYGCVNAGRAFTPLVSNAGDEREHHLPQVIPATVLAGPRVRLPARDYLLYHGPLTVASAFCSYPSYQSPNLWWPDDRTWCVASEIDLSSTYVGGSARLIKRILADQRLEALRARLSDDITCDTDSINR